MPRNRMIKPEFWTDEKVGRVSPIARLMFIGLWNLADDYGVVKGNPVYVKSQLFAYDERVISSEVAEWIESLCTTGMLHRFTIRDEQLLYITNFRKHQTVDRPSKTRNCTEEELDAIKTALGEYSTHTRHILDEYSTSTRDTLDTHSTSIRRVFDEDSTSILPEKVQKVAKDDQKQAKTEQNEGQNVIDPSVSKIDTLLCINTLNNNTNVFNTNNAENPAQPEKPPKTGRKSTAEGIAYADYFAKTLPETVKVTDTMRASWAKTFDDLMRLDKRNPDEIYKVTEYARKDNFWTTNFLSATKLRKKNDEGITYYDVFLTKINYNQQRTQSNGNRQQQPGQRERVTPADAVKQHDDLRRLFGLQGTGEAGQVKALANGAIP